MKLKEKMKRFWTLNVHNHEGFTLVELIIVIAILAILSSVAVVGYSSYVTKANKQADLTLAAEIENALMLAYYSDKLTPGDYVVIYFDKDAEYGNDNASANTIYAAMEAAYGSEWEKVLKLKHSGWAEEMGILNNSAVMDYIDGSTFDASEENLGNLLDDVQHVVGLAGGFFGSGGKTTGALKEFLESHNLPSTGDATNGTTMANATVMFVATDIKDVMAKTTTVDGVPKSNANIFAEDWAKFDITYPVIEIPNFNNLTDTFSNLAAQYAFVEALALHMDANANTKYNDYLVEASKDVSNKDAMIIAMGKVVAAINDDISNSNVAVASAMASYYGVDMSTGDVNMLSSKAYQDAMAFVGYMQGVASSADSLIGNTDLNKDHYYNDGEILDYVLDYVSMGEVLKDLQIGADEGAFVFLYNGNAIVCAPLDY